MYTARRYDRYRAKGKDTLINPLIDTQEHLLIVDTNGTSRCNSSNAGPVDCYAVHH
jgi:hypothetical protein